MINAKETSLAYAPDIRMLPSLYACASFLDAAKRGTKEILGLFPPSAHQEGGVDYT